MRAIPSLCAAALLALLLPGCTGPTVVNTEQTASRPPAPAAAPAPSTRPSNAHLANAFGYAVPIDGATGYAFTTPSGRWQCVIIPRTRAACGKAGGSGTALGITGAPEDVPGPDGDTAAPTAILVDRSGDPQFAALPAPSVTDAPVLPFNRILAVAGFRCNVQEATGISCLSELTGKGFTFSADGYTAGYTDVPADAP